MKIFYIPIILFFSVLANTINAQSKLTADIYSSYFGGSGEELSSFVAVDSNGNVIIAGTTSSKNLTVKPSSLRKYGGGEYDGFVAKFSPDMKELIFLTYVGAAYSEIRNVTVDESGDIYITGNTTAGFPVTTDAFNKNYRGGVYDGFICKYDPQGQLLYATYVGGSAIDIGISISILNNDEILLTGVTESINFPVKPAASYTNQGSFDVFLIKLNILTNTLVFSTCLGGKNMDFPSSIKTDESGNIYVSGYGTPGFPVINGLNPKLDEFGNGFIAKFNEEGEVIYCTKAFDSMVSIDINDLGEVYFISESASPAIACSENAFFKSLLGERDMVIGKINEKGDSLLYLSYFGGESNDKQNNIHYLGNEKVVITGITKSSDFPVSNILENKTISGTDITISLLDIDNKEILYSNFIGGSVDEEIWNSTMVKDSTLFVSGTTKSTDFPVSSDAYTKTFQGVSDAVMARFKLNTYQPTSINTGIKSKKINVYPNPTKGLVNLHFNNDPAQKSFVEIYNLQGNLLFSKPLNHTETIDLTDFPKGMYVVKSIAGDIVYNEKILKN
jgi:hypothetical protein